MHKISYVGDGVNTEFLFAFPFFQPADIHVIIDDVNVAQSEYSVAPNDDFSGGNIVFNVAPTENAKIDIFRHISLSRIVDYQPTAKIDPEALNADFNFLLEAFRDVYSVNFDMAQWENQYDNIANQMNYVTTLIQEKTGGAGALGLYNNLLNVVNSALPELINDYGSVTELAPNENRDDYGVL